MICPPCATAADIDTDPSVPPPDGGRIGHTARLCRDHGRDIKACGCQHRPPQDPRTPTAPQGAQK